ncbi:DUF952 domain-containing protein [Pseudorhodoplanes sp.]|uniref:DUF952 domain-containing protein n=1 Tax=Pseudorhodoplanes sp. TaxID=1934341 RepID=UPI003D10FBD0
MPTIYKILPVSLWADAQRSGVFRGAAIDLTDGYIHFSTAEQAAETAAKHFGGQHDLVLLHVDADALGNALKWEPSRGGALFPHLYAALDLKHVRRADPLPLDGNGRHVFPDLR